MCMLYYVVARIFRVVENKIYKIFDANYTYDVVCFPLASVLL